MASIFSRKGIAELLAEGENPSGLRRTLGVGDLIMLSIGAVIGSRSPEGRDWYRRYWESSVDVPGEAVDVMAEIARDSAMARGTQLFISGGCIGCHAMVGTPMAGQMGVIGPNLSHVGSRATLAGGMMPNTDENLARWLRDPQAVKPGTLMKLPRPLTEEEVQTLVAYLRAHQ